MAHGEEGHPRETKILSIGEHVLHEQVRIATMIEVTTQVSLFLRVHDVNVVGILEVIAKRFAGLR